MPSPREPATSSPSGSDTERIAQKWSRESDERYCPTRAANANSDERTIPKATEQNDRTNEFSPLLRPRTSEEELDTLSPALSTILTPPSSITPFAADTITRDQHHHETKSSAYLFLLTLSISGLQIAWCVELSNGSPYLLSLGISKSLLAFVWIAGPLSGTLVQPYVGMKSDRCRSRFGRRRPFMVGGAVATVVSLLLLAWVGEIVRLVLDPVAGREGKRDVTIVLAVVMIYVLDFSINVVQAAIRAFIVDNAPSHQQDAANAWASRMSGVGNILGYLFGYVDLPRYVWFLGQTQFQVLCVLASLSMLATLAVSCLSITERDPRLDGPPPEQANGLLSFFKDLYRSVRKLPKQIKAVCMVQFFAWIGWFPFLFYITTYIAEIYVQPIFAANPEMTEEQINAVWERATRVGTFALFMFAITTFGASIVLPFLVVSTGKVHGDANSMSSLQTPRASQGGCLSSLRSSRHHNKFLRLIARVPSLEIEHLTLRRAWLFSHILFATSMWLTLFVHSTIAATVLVAFVGIPWAMTNWAPFALIAAEISKRDAVRRGLVPSRPTRAEALDDASGEADQAGVVLGIHNVAIAAPQVIATLVSSAIFQAMQKPRGSVGDESMAWVLRFGGLCALVAAWFTRRVGERRTF